MRPTCYPRPRDTHHPTATRSAKAAQLKPMCIFTIDNNVIENTINTHRSNCPATYAGQSPLASDTAEQKAHPGQARARGLNPFAIRRSE